MASTQDYIAAGLYDPACDVASERLEMLEWLEGLGLTIDEMLSADAVGWLSSLASDRRAVPGQRLRRANAITLSGMEPDDFDAYTRALGFTHIAGAPAGEIGLTSDEIKLFMLLSMFRELFSHEETVGLLRVIGSAAGRIGEAIVSLFLADIESEMATSGKSQLDMARMSHDALGMLDQFGDLFDPVLRRHVVQASERTRRAEIGHEDRSVFRYAVGFVDLVGFTEISGTMNSKDLGVFIREFEGRSHDVVTAVGARVVKLIGDEVMFVATDPVAACLAGSALMQGFGDETDRVVPRGGLAYGDVLVRGGDYYGSVVNLAARLVNEAVPQELLVTEELAQATENCEFLPAGRRMVKGFAEPITVQSFVAG